MASWLIWVMVIVGGIAAAIQAPVNATLAQHIQSIPASLVSFTVGSLSLLVVTLLTLRGHGLSGLVSGFAAAPGWSYLGGICGAFLVTAVILGTGTFGVNATLSVLTAVQLVAALVIDAVGLGAAAAVPIRWPQVVGVLLIIGGVKLVLTR